MSWRVPSEWRERVEAVASPEFPRLGARLASVALAVDRDLPIVDVGTDHGRLAQALVRAERVPFAVAIDRSAATLVGARETLYRERRAGRALLVHGDGLTAIRGSVQATLVGLGGRNIVEIVRASSDVPERIVTQPLTLHHEVRVGLASLGFAPEDESLVQVKGRFFLTMTFTRGECEVPAGEDKWIGRVLRERGGVLFEAWIAAQVEWLAESSRHRDADRRERLAALRSVLGE